MAHSILFHEACLELGIPVELYLGIPVESFRQTSVAFAGAGWVARYRYLTKQLPVHILLPNAEDGVWEQANDWMPEAALDGGGTNMTHITF